MNSQLKHTQDMMKNLFPAPKIKEPEISVTIEADGIEFDAMMPKSAVEVFGKIKRETVKSEHFGQIAHTEEVYVDDLWIELSLSFDHEVVSFDELQAEAWLLERE